MRYLFCGILLCIFSLNAQSIEECLTCHSDEELQGLTEKAQQISMYIDSKLYENSVHASLNCVDCHQDLEGITDYPHDEKLNLVTCGNCHEDVNDEYNQSLHGLKFIGMDSLAPKCSDCHRKHDILSSTDPSSSIFFQNLPNTCCGCHQSKKSVLRTVKRKPCVREKYMKGVHGHMLSEGLESAPTCNTCHPAHSIRKRIDPLSTIYKLNISHTCGQCHIDALTDYGESIHFSALRHGVLESATCTDCHGEHEILPPDSAVFIASHDACIGCHNDTKVAEKYGISITSVSTFVDSYHGLSIKLGNKRAATCSSCHENHHIHMPENLHSSVHENNIVQTCQKCHENSTMAFAMSYTHEAMLVKSKSLNYFITLIYLVLIIGVIGAMFLHNVIIFLKYIRNKRQQESKYYVIRFKKAEIFQHATLMISFTLLAISGFALKFPDAWWVNFFESLGIHEWARRLVHRFSAVVLVMVSLYHLYYVIFNRRGRYILKQIMFRKTDLQEFLQTLKYYLGLSKTKPQYEEFDYTEKAEYWSLVWGNMVMALTGFILWFPSLMTKFAPAWVIRAAELVHFYEAILATLAIIIFHLFFVIVHPEQYPMNLSWLTGKMSLSAAIHKHPRWLSRMVRDKVNIDLLPETIRHKCNSVEDMEDYINKTG